MRDIEVRIFTKTGGWLSTFGKDLWLGVQKFSFFFRQATVSDNLQSNPAGVQRKRVLCGAEFDVSSIEPMHVVDGQRQPKANDPLNSSNKNHIKVAMNGPQMLDEAGFKKIRFDLSEDGPDYVSGMLHLKGFANFIQCKKKVDPSWVVVTCPVLQQQFGMRPYALAGGVLKLDSEVTVQVHVPAEVYNHGAWWFK